MRNSVLVGVVLSSVALLGAAGPSTAPVELKLVNGGFEQGLTGWDAKGDAGMSVLSADAARTGKQGVRVTDDSDTRGSSLMSTPLPAKPGVTYTLTFAGRQVEGGHGYATYLQFLDADGKLLTRQADKNEIITSVRGEQWKTYTLEGKAPENAARVRVWLHTSSSGKGLKIDLDDFKIVEEMK
jgi:hypothetical protein